ncbi:GNAT family N-acetyltransferase [Roseomonas sp. F4]
MLSPIRPFGVAASLPIRIERITLLPDQFDDLAADAIGDGQRILEVVREDWQQDVLRFSAAGDALFAAFAGQALLGLCGLTRDPYLSLEHIGRVRRLYVLRPARRAGVGRALVEAVASAATAHGYARLRVRAPVSAHTFYERCGFLRAVGARAATHIRPLMQAV